MNEPHPETLFQQSILNRIAVIEDISRKAFHLKGKSGRRTHNGTRHHVTKLTNFLQHRKSCIQGYRAKVQLANAAKGCNTTSGIPEIFLALA
jgi:hypothetical protein